MFLDTSVLVELLINDATSGRFKAIYDHIESEPAFISTVQIAELADWCLANHIDPAEALDLIGQIAELTPMDESTLITAARLKREMRTQGAAKFSLMDGIILASARAMNEQLLTFDSDFRPAEDVIVLD